jgi:hypothetical protein
VDGCRSVLSAVVGSNSLIRAPRTAVAAACLPQESHLAVAAYSSPHVQSEWVTGSPPFLTSHPTWDARGLAKPSRGGFERDCRTRSERRFHIAAGTPALVWLSTARRRAISPGNAFPGTLEVSRPLVSDRSELILLHGSTEDQNGPQIFGPLAKPGDSSPGPPDCKITPSLRTTYY